MAVIVKVVGCGSVQMSRDFTVLSGNAPDLRSLCRIIASCSFSFSRHRSVVTQSDILNVYSITWVSARNIQLRRAIELQTILASVRQVQRVPAVISPVL